MPAPSWLIDTIIPAGGLVAIYGEPGCGKSFIALDIAFCVATGRPWQGHPVEQGYVLYIAAEGGTGIGKRARAWLLHQQVKPSQAEMAWLVESIPVHVDSDQMTTLLERVMNEIERHPSLVIIDTLARCFDGEESETGDMGRFIAGVDHLRAELGCTVLVIHHTRLAGDRERGNTAFRGAADAMLSVEKDGTDIAVSCTKQKDAEEFEPINLELSKVEGTESCIVGTSSTLVKVGQEQDLIFDRLCIAGPCRWDDWRETTGLSRSRFQVAYERLRKQKRVEKTEGGLWKVIEPVS